MASEWLVSPPSSPLTHEDNREFLRMLREKKERYKCTYKKLAVVARHSIRVCHIQLSSLE
jgi:hypothetical protein